MAIIVLQPSILAVINAPKPTAPVPKIAMDEPNFGCKPFTTVPQPVKNPHPNGP
ncbi:hypothetical protein ACIQZG_24095 [Lysinibacillus sp. NPDC096418]|uniref:hypothetical protein n=1 Tax=Lysinibacillus sp. NPDC096418 TaxID=3364138 RepID=UPI003810EEDE